MRGLGDSTIARCELFLEDILKQTATVVPDGVVLWILLEEGGDLLESGVCEVAGLDLKAGCQRASVSVKLASSSRQQTVGYRS